jgi:alpha-glutamyl/putrescinyl thymine pyrophosphorylase-like protein
MPSFCRHGRLEANCKICSPLQSADAPRSRAATGPRRAATGPRRGPARSSTKKMTVRRMARAEDDGYSCELVLGLRATQDGARLADELAFAAARLRQLRDTPPGLYGDVAGATDPEEAAWLCLQIAYLQPLEAPDPWSAITAVRVPWAGGELPALDGVELGPRSAHNPARGAEMFSNYRAFASRAGSQIAALAGEAAWAPARRFDRAYERLAMRDLPRAPRFDFLVTLGALGIVDVNPSSLALGAEPADPTVVAAKRVFGIGDAINLQRRASDLAAETGVSIAALDLALVNWARTPEERIRAGATAAVDDAERERIATALGVTDAEPPAADPPAVESTT